VLVIASVFKNHDAVLWSRFAVSQFQHFGFYVHGVTVKQGLGKTHFIPSQIGNGGAKRGVTHRNTHYQAQCENAVDNALPIFCVVLAIFFIQMQRSWVVRECREHDVVHFGNRAPYRVLENLSDKKLFEIQTCHD